MATKQWAVRDVVAEPVKTRTGIYTGLLSVSWFACRGSQLNRTLTKKRHIPQLNVVYDAISLKLVVRVRVLRAAGSWVFWLCMYVCVCLSVCVFVCVYVHRSVG